MVIIVTEEPLFLEACTKPFCRKRRFAAREAALGEGEKLPEPARRRSAIFCTKARHQPPDPVQRRKLLKNTVEGRAAPFFDMPAAQHQLPRPPFILALARLFLAQEAYLLLCGAEHGQPHGAVARTRPEE